MLLVVGPLVVARRVTASGWMKSTAAGRVIYAGSDCLSEGRLLGHVPRTQRTWFGGHSWRFTVPRDLVSIPGGAWSLPGVLLRFCIPLIILLSNACWCVCGYICLHSRHLWRIGKYSAYAKTCNVIFRVFVMTSETQKANVEERLWIIQLYSFSWERNIEHSMSWNFQLYVVFVYAFKLMIITLSWPLFLLNQITLKDLFFINYVYKTHTWASKNQGVGGGEQGTYRSSVNQARYL